MGENQVRRGMARGRRSVWCTFARHHTDHHRGSKQRRAFRLFRLFRRLRRLRHRLTPPSSGPLLPPPGDGRLGTVDGAAIGAGGGAVNRPRVPKKQVARFEGGCDHSEGRLARGGTGRRLRVSSAPARVAVGADGERAVVAALRTPLGVPTNPPFGVVVTATPKTSIRLSAACTIAWAHACIQGGVTPRHGEPIIAFH